jgi:glycosyltransferase involved in cell wall biosynthesis
MPKEVRVLHIMADPMTGVLLVEPIVRRQLAQGYRVELACGPGEYLEQLIQLGYRVTVIPIARRLFALSHIQTFIALRRLLKLREYSIVHLHTPIAAFIGRLAAASVRTLTIIYHMRTSWWESPSLLVRTLFTLLEKIAGYWTSYIFTINCSDSADLVNRGIIKSTQVTCLHCGGSGVNLQRFDPSRFLLDQTIKMKVEFGLQPADFVIGFIGRIVEEKGIIELLESFAKLAATHTDIKLLLVGGVLSSERDRETESKVKKIISNHALSKCIVCTGFRSDIPDLLSLMDLIILPSHREGFGMVLAEAAAMGKPVISTCTRGGREAVENGKNGLLVPVNDSSALFQAMFQLYQDRDLCYRMGIEGRKRAEECFDEQILYKRIDSVYSKFVNEIQ